MDEQPDAGTTAGRPVQPGPLAYAMALRAAGGQPLEERLRGSGDACVGVGLYVSPTCDLDLPALPVSRLSIALTPTRFSGALDGHRRQVWEAARYALFLAPAGAGARWRKEAPSRHLAVFFDADALADGDGDGMAPRPDDPPLLNAQLPGIRALADELVTELQAGPQWSAEAADSLGRLLLIRVARHRARRRSADHPLTPALQARLVDYVQAHLSERILVGDLARVVGLSAHRFAQAYTTSTGQSPYQFVLAQRLRRAESMLLHDDSSLAQVAAECGFASQQHLTQVMRQRCGTTPARYRRQHGEATETGAAELASLHALTPGPGARHRAALDCR